MRLLHQGLEIDVEHHTHRGLGIAVDDKHPITAQREIVRKMLTGGRLTDAALEILHGDDDREFRWQLPHFDAQSFANGKAVFGRIETAAVRSRLGRPDERLSGEEVASRCRSRWVTA